MAGSIISYHSLLSFSNLNQYSIEHDFTANHRTLSNRKHHEAFLPIVNQYESS